MNRLLLTLRFNGAAYHGWQVQPNAVTVQSVLEDAAARVFGAQTAVTGCSRTDAHVHANMFCCHLDTEKDLCGERACSALNFYLPRDIAVWECKRVRPDFHARYDCDGKEYIYRIWNERQRDPFLNQRVLHINVPLDTDRMHQAAQAFVGRHDFAAFCAAGSDVQSTVRTVRYASVTRQAGEVRFTVCADGFLYNMVRIMVGTLLDVSRGAIPLCQMEDILRAGDRSRAGATAPAQGLYLNRVFYNGGDIDEA